MPLIGSHSILPPLPQGPPADATREQMLAWMRNWHRAGMQRPDEDFVKGAAWMATIVHDWLLERT